MLKHCFTFLTFIFCCNLYAQEITSFVQFNGRYDYTAIGNTLNPAENNLDGSFCNLLETSSATLDLNPNFEIAGAYLFWAGSGLGDTEVTLNDTNFVADETYNVFFEESTVNILPYFSCVKDITDFVLEQGNTTYTLSDLDVSETLSMQPRYCANRTNFAGWSIYVIYKDTNLPLNQVNLFVGLEIINRFVNEKTITINNLNVLDNEGAKIGFLAWEGDNALNYGESLSINGNTLSSPPLNNVDNAFNGTNSFTNSNTFYNGDLDVYNIENNINIGDTEATIKLTTGGFDVFGTFRADLIILNNVITVLNSQVPDATVTLDNYSQICNTNEIDIEFTVSNLNSTEILPSNVPIAIYADTLLIGQTATTNPIPINGSETITLTLNLPDTIPDNFTLTIDVDNDGTGNSTVIEISETNNTSISNQIKLPIPEIFSFNIIQDCQVSTSGFSFDLTSIITPELESNYTNFVYYDNASDFENQTNEISNPENYTTTILPVSIFVSAEKPICFDILEIELNADNCPPIIPDAISPNNDGLNDFLNITFANNKPTKYRINIFNRYGLLIFKGSEQVIWDGTSNRGINKNKKLPIGTYFYTLNTENKQLKTQTGYIYLTY